MFAFPLSDFLARRRARLLAVLIAVMALAAGVWTLQQRSGEPPAELDFESAQTLVKPLRDDMFALITVAVGFTAGNMTIQIGPEGVLVVDTQYQQLARKNFAAIRELTLDPIKYVVNTHMHVDHVSGNEAFRLNADPAGAVDSLSAGGAASAEAAVVAHENALRRLRRPIAEGGRRREVWPTQTYAAMESELTFNGATVRLLHQPAAHTDGDTFVHFVNSDVISTGDIFHNERYPFIDRLNGGSIEGIVAGLNRLVELTAASGAVDGATLIVPGHGDVATEADVVAYRDMIVTIRDRIRYMIDSGMSLAQVQTARPTSEYDERYGLEAGFWTTGEFVAAVYLELAAAASNVE